jgi:hypothetical protein
MSVEKNPRKILGPFVFLFGIALLAGFAWVLITAQDGRIINRLIGGVFVIAFSASFLVVGYDWMRGRVSRIFPRNEDEENDKR